MSYGVQKPSQKVLHQRWQVIDKTNTYYQDGNTIPTILGYNCTLCNRLETPQAGILHAVAIVSFFQEVLFC